MLLAGVQMWGFCEGCLRSPVGPWALRGWLKGCQAGLCKQELFSSSSEQACGSACRALRPAGSSLEPAWRGAAAAVGLTAGPDALRRLSVCLTSCN